MNSERRKKLKARGVYDGNNRGIVVYDTEDAKQPKPDIDPNTGLETYSSDSNANPNAKPEPDLGFDINNEKPTSSPRLASSENMLEKTSDDAKSGPAKFFGFVRSQFDDASDEWKQKQQAKEDTYKNFKDYNPNVLNNEYVTDKDRMKNYYKERFNQDFADKINNNSPNPWQEFKSNFGGMLGNVGRVPPEKLLGFTGSVVGPFPKSQQMKEYEARQSMSQYGVGVNAQGQQVRMPTRGGMPNKYAQPGRVGAQVPKYSARPSYARPNTEFQRVTKTDPHGKKRSYLRKVRGSGNAQEQVTVQDNTANVRQFAGVDISQQGISRGSQLARMNPAALQQQAALSNLDDNILNALKKR